MPTKLAAILFLFSLIKIYTLESTTVEDVPYVVNLDDRCMRCLCHAATGCNLTFTCDSGYCGPFKIARLYWKDAGEVILPGDDLIRDGAYEDCAISYHCAKKIVKNYIIKYGRDCNSDGKTDCDDYSMINFNGGFHCNTPLERSDSGRYWLQRYKRCYDE